MSAQRIHAAARNADVAEQQLHHCPRANHLRTGGVLGPSEGVHDGHGTRRRCGRGDKVPDMHDTLFRRAANPLHHLRHIARVVLLQQAVDAARMRQGRIDLGKAVGADLVLPAGLIVAVFLGVIARIDALGECKLFADDERQVGVMTHVVMLDLVVGQQIIDQASEKDDIGAGSDRRVVIGDGGRAREPRIDDDQLRLVVGLGFDDPLEAAGVRLGGVAAHDEHDVRILDVNPVIRHRSTAKRRGKTCHRRTVSHTRLVIES